MKVTIKTADLKRVLKDAARVAEKKSTIPVLSHVLLECLPSGVRLSVTDLEISRQEMLEYVDPLPEDAPKWSRAVSVSALEALLPKTIARVKTSPVVILTPAKSDDPDAGEDENALYISVGGASTMLRCLPPEDFPILPFDVDTPEPAVIPGEQYRQTVKNIFSAISTEESRFQLSGALFEFNGRLRIVSTDGHRLSRSETEYRSGTYRERIFSALAPSAPPPWPDSRNSFQFHGVEIGPQEDSSFLVPRKALAVMLQDSAFGPIKRPTATGEVYKSGKRKGEPKTKSTAIWADVYIAASDQHIFFETSRGTRYVARILEGSFPDVERVIKKEIPDLIISTNAESLRRAMAAVSHMTGDRARVIRWELDGDLPVVSAANPDAGTSSATMNGATTMTGRMGLYLDAKTFEKRVAMSEKARKRAEIADEKKDRPESIGVNPDYVVDAVANLAGADAVEIHLYTANSQFQIAFPGSSDVRVIMPIRL